MFEATYTETDMAMTGDGSRTQGDENLLVKFYLHPKLDEAKSQKKGRPIYRDTEYISIIQAGNKESIIKRPASELDKSRFPEHYRRFKDRTSQDIVEGTLLEEWPGVTRSQCEELKFFNVFTVEQLANISDVNAQGKSGITMLKQKAQSYLEASKDEAVSEALLAANERVETLEAMVKDLTARLDAQDAEVEDEEEEEYEE